MAISQIKAGSTNHNLIASNVAYGTCATAAATAAKVVTVSAGWELTAGAIVSVKFTYTNTASNPTLNVNSTGAKSIWYNTALITTSSLSYAGYANRVAMYMYDGTQYVFQGWSLDNNSDTKVTMTVAPDVTSATSRYPIMSTSSSTNTNTTVKRTSCKLTFLTGTTSTDGYDFLYLGNATAEGTAGNSYGALRLYSKSTSYHSIVGAANTSAITHTLPAVSGTIINSGNIDDYVEAITTTEIDGITFS